MTDFNLDWKSIRPLNGSQDKGFEELCAQLARYEIPSNSRFFRKGTTDAGVECFAVLDDLSEWGWQAKYFDKLAEDQYKQIDESVRTALNKHPKLTKYIICVPYDRPDARVKNQTSSLDKWEQHEKKWIAWATEKSMCVEFVFRGSHELLELLAHEQHIGRVRFWFNREGFDTNWFELRLSESIQTAGPRYTPELHLELPMEEQFDLLGRSEKCESMLRKYAKTLRKELSNFERSLTAADIKTTSDGSLVTSKLQAVITSIGTISVTPTGPIGLEEISNEILDCQKNLTTLQLRLSKLLSEQENKKAAHSAKSPRMEELSAVYSLSYELENTAAQLVEIHKKVSTKVLVLTGEAGNGKTHLFCDLAKKRLAKNKPTILLMGQRFLTNELPWTQVLNQLDLRHTTVDVFVGALEAAAQSADCRALLLIDALNEGMGLTIWPENLAAFIERLAQSPWIAIAVSVRSSYQDIVISSEIRSQAISLFHDGFAHIEYEAARSFFKHYAIEFPSTPILSPEFSNPLFLKTICVGLNLRGEVRLPRGLQGITAIFDLFVSAVNDKLARILDFDPKAKLVSRSLNAICLAMLELNQRWLKRSKAQSLADELLPNRDFQRSLFRALISEGFLVEEVSRVDDDIYDEIIFVAYDRFADHLIAKAILDKALLNNSFTASNKPDGPLAFLSDSTTSIAPGFLEALCTQLPERTGRELSTMEISKLQIFPSAFRRSLIWRSPQAFSRETLKHINQQFKSQRDSSAMIDVLITLTVIPEHPLNANFLNTKLLTLSMPDRDAWWSIAIHSALGKKKAIDRLLDWALSINSNTDITEEVALCCATTIAWMFSSSNRFLRDKATLAMVNLLNGRLKVLQKIVRNFAQVNDPYVSERVYAVAYGVAMLSCDSEAITEVAKQIFEIVFLDGAPHPHVLLRDYARGVIERAHHLDPLLDINMSSARPPYKSVWPHIPNKKELRPYLPQWGSKSKKKLAIEWAKYHIGSSVLTGDFACYVIGTNSGSVDWMPILLAEPVWKSPDEKIQTYRENLDSSHLQRWEAFEAASKAYASARFFSSLAAESESKNDKNRVDRERRTKSLLAKKNRLKATMLRNTAGDVRTMLLDILHVSKAKNNLQFDLSIMQNYILRRVFDLGWSTKLFGNFDSNIIETGRDSHKSERIGKKYQWIAYHEILAYLSDHYQYRDVDRGVDKPTGYQGTWQAFLRDIDPSCLAPFATGGTSWTGHKKSWWCPISYADWDKFEDQKGWITSTDDLPETAKLLMPTHASDNSSWINVNTFQSWKQELPAEKCEKVSEQKEIWYIAKAYLVRSQDAQQFMAWSENTDFWGRWMPEPQDIYKLFLGEHAWSPASIYFEDSLTELSNWINPGRECPVDIHPVSLRYVREGNTTDCSLNETFNFRLLNSALLNGLKLTWSGTGADFVDGNNKVIAQDPTATVDGPDALLVRRENIQSYLKQHNLELCWSLVGEKRILNPSLSVRKKYCSLQLSGAYRLDSDNLNGFTKCFLLEPGQTLKDKLLIKTLRT